MSDYILTNGITRSGRAVDIEIRDGRIDRLVDAGGGDPGDFDADQRFDAGGRLVTPPFAEVHTHLDTALTAGMPRWNKSGTLEEGWPLWVELRDDISKASIVRRAKKNVYWFAANGVTRIRTHVDTSMSNHKVVDALVELREEVADIVEIQLVGFPLDSVVLNDDKLDLMEEALDRGVDLVGGIPHKENTREDGVEHVRSLVEIADRHDAPIDFHIDETDDPNSRYTEVLANEALKRGIGSRTTASHTTAMHSYSNAYADKLIRLLAESGLSVITNPLANAVLQGRYDDYPRRRGHTRIEELRAAGVPVGMGQDDVMDAFHHYGDGDPLKTAFVLLHFAHLDGYDDVETLWNLMLEGNAEVYGLDEYGLAEGNEGSLVVYDAPDAFNALRTQPPRSLVLRDGVPIASAERSATVFRSGDEERVEFNHVS